MLLGTELVLDEGSMGDLVEGGGGKLRAVSERGRDSSCLCGGESFNLRRECGGEQVEDFAGVSLDVLCLEKGGKTVSVRELLSEKMGRGESHSSDRQERGGRLKKFELTAGLETGKGA